MQAFGTQNFNDPKVEEQRQAELVKLGRVVETKRNELAGACFSILPMPALVLTLTCVLSQILRKAGTRRWIDCTK